MTVSWRERAVRTMIEQPDLSDYVKGLEDYTSRLEEALLAVLSDNAVDMLGDRTLATLRRVAREVRRT